MQSEKESIKKTKASKRLKFDEQAEQFVFKPRRPMTRRFQQVQEAPTRTEEIGEETQRQQRKNTGKTVNTFREENIADLKRKLE